VKAVVFGAEFQKLMEGWHEELMETGVLGCAHRTDKWRECGTMIPASIRAGNRDILVSLVPYDPDHYDANHAMVVCWPGGNAEITSGDAVSYEAALHWAYEKATEPEPRTPATVTDVLAGIVSRLPAVAGLTVSQVAKALSLPIADAEALYQDEITPARVVQRLLSGHTDPLAVVPVRPGAVAYHVLTVAQEMVAQEMVVREAGKAAEDFAVSVLILRGHSQSEMARQLIRSSQELPPPTELESRFDFTPLMAALRFV
jgi:hypothetical protein